MTIEHNDINFLSESLPPLPERMRPQSFEDYCGQAHLVAKGSVLRTMIENGNLNSLILWGPPGVGKTTLVHIIAKILKRDFYTLSATNCGVKDVKEVIEKAKGSNLFKQAGTPLLFIDEIHRFNKTQQDSLLAAVENGTITLIGATSENPSFEIITPLLSRCQVFVLKSLEKEDLDRLLHRAVREDIILKKKNIKIEESDLLYAYSGGDARKMLNILDIVVQAQSKSEDIIIDNRKIRSCIQENITSYDKNQDLHYDVTSALIKSIRGSDPNAAVYYLAKMLNGGEDPLFIARRLCISAAEDIGLANPNALLLANSCMQIVKQIGMPEARIPLSETVIYLASSPKSNSAYMAINQAIEFDKKTPGTIPLHLRNAASDLMKDLGYGIGYKYAHDYPNHFVDLEFMPTELQAKVFYEPQDNKHENALKNYLLQCWPKYYSKK